MVLARVDITMPHVIYNRYHIVERGFKLLEKQYSRLCDSLTTFSSRSKYRISFLKFSIDDIFSLRIPITSIHASHLETSKRIVDVINQIDEFNIFDNNIRLTMSLY